MDAAGTSEPILRRRISAWIVVMIVGLVLAGLTAFPLAHEIRWLAGVVNNPGLALAQHAPWFVTWIDRVDVGVTQTSRHYPFMAYGTDWLAYAHLMIAVLFIGPLRDPIRNVWVIQFGLIACVTIIPVALIAGPVRHIPMWWSAVDMSFGVFGAVPLLVALRYIRRLEMISTDAAAPIPAGAA
jgi:hypothetical protein